MVVATKYRLETPKSINKGTWDEKGAKTKLTTKLVPRAYVEERNSTNNRELYIIDEEATKEFLAQREANIKSKANKKVSSNETADAIKDLAEALKGDSEDKPKRKRRTKAEIEADKEQ
jgi:hypothetical protein